MGLFGRKPSHAKQVEATWTVFGNLMAVTVEERAGAPEGLDFKRPDSVFRYAVFCLSATHAACEYKMSNPDAVLNESLSLLVQAVVGSPDDFLSGQMTSSQEIANRAAALLQDFLQRWSAWMEIAKGKNSPADHSLVIAMIYETESPDPISDGDGERLCPLAIWIESRLGAMSGAFGDMT